MRTWLGDFVMRFWSHIFVIATGFAALTHSTWTLATAFGGQEPAISTHWLAWVFPGLLIAFAFDIGQIAISVDLRNGERTKPKYIAFCVLAISTYFLQWWYLAHHLPLMNLAAGVRPEWQPFAAVMSDAIVWVAPALLPLATTLYTFSYAKPKRPASKSQPTNAMQPPANYQRPHFQNMQTRLLQDSDKIAALPAPDMEAMFIAECPHCGWRKPCETDRKRINALNAHQRYCPAKVDANRGEQKHD